MLDIKFLRENPEIVKQNIRNKFQDSKLPLVDQVIELDKKNREIKQEVESLRAERNKISKMIGGLMKEGKREEAEEAKKKKKDTKSGGGQEKKSKRGRARRGKKKRNRQCPESRSTLCPGKGSGRRNQKNYDDHSQYH